MFLKLQVETSHRVTECFQTVDLIFFLFHLQSLGSGQVVRSHLIFNWKADGGERTRWRKEKTTLALKRTQLAS